MKSKWTLLVYEGADYQLPAATASSESLSLCTPQHEFVSPHAVQSPCAAGALLPRSHFKPIRCLLHAIHSRHQQYLC